MTITSTGVASVVPSDVDRDQVLGLQRALEAGWAGAQLVTASGQSFAIPEGVCDILVKVVQEMAVVNAVTVPPARKQLTTQQAADLFGVSRPLLVRLLVDRVIPHVMVGTHRRVELADLVAYQDQRKRDRRSALDHLAALSAEAGLEI